MFTAFAPQRCASHGLLQGEREAVTSDATTLFVDLAGFTPLTERLARLGSRGTEELSRLLRGFFGAVTDVVLDRGGDPVAYGGDALTIVFDGPAPSTGADAMRCAEAIQELARRTAGSTTVAGHVSLQARIGIARGSVTTAVASSVRRSLPVHLGAGLDRAVAAEGAAEAGHIVVHASATAAPESSSQRPGDPPPTFVTAGADTHAALARFVHPLVAARLGVGGELLESHRTVTVAFVRFPPPDLRLLSTFLGLVAEMLELVDTLGGEVVQVCGGDKGVVAMLVFGAPVAHDDDPLRAVQTLLDIRRRQRDVAVGAATGPVFTALLGSDRRRFAANSGPAVNLAARLMQAASPGEVLVEGRTWQASAVHLRARGRPVALTLKGVEGPVEVRIVTGWRRGSARRSPVATSPIVGREIELNRVEAFLDAVSDARGPTLVLEGEPGAGKSRLAAEAADRAATRGARVLVVDASDHRRGRATGLWRDILAQLSGLRPGGRREWSQALARLLPDVRDQVPALGPLIGVGLPDSALTRAMPPDIKVEAAQALFARTLRDAARRQPLLVVLENEHHLDDAAVALVAYLARTLAGACTGLLLTRRPPDAAQPDRLVGLAEVLALRSLPAADAGLVAVDAWAEAGGGTAPAWLQAFVAQRAGGNPLFVRAIAQAVWSRWQPGEPPPETSLASGSLAALLSERVDLLATADRQLLNLLAVAARPVGLTVAQAVLPEPDEATVRGTARALAAADLVQVDARGEGDLYRIRHELLQHVVYEAMSHAERLRLHRRLADELAGSGADALEVAGHVEELDDPDLGRRWFPLAAASARSSWALSEAIRWWRCALPLLEGTPRAEAEVELLELLLVGGRPREVIELGREGGIDPSQPLLAARRLYAQAEAAFISGQLDRSEEAVTRVLVLTDGLDEIRHQRASELLVRVRSERGDTRGARQTARAQLARAEASGDPRAIATAHASLGLALVLAELPVEATAHYEAAQARAEALGDVVLAVHVVSDLAGCCHAVGDYAGCIRLLAEAREAADGIGYRRHLAYSLTNEAQLRCSLGDDGARMCAALAVQRSLELDDPATASDALHSWLSATPRSGGSARGWTRLVRLDLAQGRYGAAADGSAELALALARTGHRTQARSAAAEATRMAGDMDLPRVLRRAELARLLAACPRKGSRDAGRISALLEALAALGAEEGVDEVDRAELAMERWRLTHAASDREGAVEAVREALEAEPSVGVRAWVVELGEPPPSVAIALPPPIGVGDVRTTRAQLDEALTAVELAVFGTATPTTARRSRPRRPKQV
jgi:class 3 adenylate cyclase/tetratricopeptide (TPR) repeat protein